MACPCSRTWDGFSDLHRGKKKPFYVPLEAPGLLTWVPDAVPSSSAFIANTTPLLCSGLCFSLWIVLPCVGCLARGYLTLSPLPTPFETSNDIPKCRLSLLGVDGAFLTRQPLFTEALIFEMTVRSSSASGVITMEHLCMGSVLWAGLASIVSSIARKWLPTHLLRRPIRHRVCCYLDLGLHSFQNLRNNYC